MAVVIHGDTGINPVTASGTSASVDGMTVGRGGGEVATNTAVGAGVLATNTTGSSNTAIGYQAFQGGTTASNNTAVGYQASFNTTGNGNSSYGVQAFYTNTTGVADVAIGQSALFANTTGSYNTALGRESLYSNTTASNNTAVGYQALYSNTTGIQFAALGYQAGYSNTSGGSNGCYIGYKAGYSATGSCNTFVGAANQNGNGCGQLVTTGTRNTILGGFDGNQGGLDIRTASNNIVLSDGDGNPRLLIDSSENYFFSCVATPSTSVYGLAYITSGGSNGYLYNTVSSTGSASQMIFGNANGTCGSIQTSGSTTSYSTSSDHRLKNTIASMTGALAKVALLKPVTYKWNSDGSDGQGFIAHELAEVVPDCVTGAKDAVDADGNPVYQGIDTSYLVATLTKAIQELKTIVDAQATEIAELKAKVA